MSKPQNIEELFRSRLGDAEITPSPGAWKGVQRKLRMKSFLRFDAGRFNIWYAGALLIAGTAAVLVLNQEPSERSLSGQGELPVFKELPEKGGENTSREEKREAKREVKKNIRQSEDKVLKTEESKRRVSKAESETEHREQPAEAPAAVKSGDEKSGESPDSSAVYHGPVAQFTASETTGCAPLRVAFRNSSVYASVLSWSFGNGEYSLESDPEYTFETAGIYAVALTARGEAGDSSVHYEVIRVYPAPVAGFEMVEGLQQSDGSVTVELMNYSTGAYAFSWEMLSGDGKKMETWSSNEFQPGFSNSDIPEGAGMISLVALNEHGCTDTAFAEISSLSSASRSLRFPTVFSGNPTGPSGGFYNPNEIRLDVFRPHFSEQPAEYHLRVYSKTGEVIFETRDILQGWDGYYMEAATPSGVYIWVATGTWQNGSAINLRGDVTLLWNSR